MSHPAALSASDEVMRILALIEAVALNFADNTDAKMETFTELLESTYEKGWLGYNRLLDSNVRATRSE